MDFKKLRKAGIDEKYWEYCFISPDGEIFTPLTEESGNVLLNGYDAYNEWQRKLRKAGIDEKYWEYCFISPDGEIFTPLTEESGNVLLNGYDAYNEWQRKTGVAAPEMTSYSEQLAAVIVNLAKQKLEIDEIKRVSSQLVSEIDKLSGGVKNV